MPTAIVRLNAFDKDSNKSYSQTVETTSLSDFKAQEKNFDNSVPFSRFYFDHEVQDGDEELMKAIEEYFNDY